MELQFQSSTCRCMKAEVREARNTELTQEVRLSDGMPDVGRVIASWGQIILRSKEWQGSLVTVSGGIMVWCLYAPEDGSSPRTVDAWVPFQLKWELKDADGEGQVRVYPLLRFVDGRGIAARKIMIRAGVGALAEALRPVQRQIYLPEELPDDIQLLKNTYPIRLMKEAGEKTFLLDEDLQLPTGGIQPERLLAYTITPQIQEKRIAADKLVIRGTARLHVLYRCAEGKVHAADAEIPIAHYAQLEETYGSDAQADVMMGITSLELLQNEGSQLRVKSGMVCQYLITDRQLLQVVEDAYSPGREVELRREELKLSSVLDQRTEVVQAHQKMPAVAADAVVDTVCLPDFPRQSRMGEQITLDCPGQFQLLYYTPEGTLQGTSTNWEHTVQMMADPVSHMSFLVQPPTVVQAVSAADELHLSSQIKMESWAEACGGIEMVTGLDVSPVFELDEGRPSLILCRSDGQSLWEIAKRCGSTVEKIMRVNHLEDVPQENQMLLIPVS